MQVDLNLGELDLTSQDEYILDEVDGGYLTIFSFLFSFQNSFSVLDKLNLLKFWFKRLAEMQEKFTLFYYLLLVHIQENLEDELVKEALKAVCIIASCFML